MRRPLHPHSQSRRSGAVLLLLMVLIGMFAAIMTLAVDYGRVQLIKTQMQRTADATARGYMQYYISGGQSNANTNGPSLYSSANNPIDANSGISPTVAVTWGYWSPLNSTFSTTSSAGTVPAVQVTVKRTHAGGNAVPLFWGGMMGFLSIDEHVTAIAAEMGGESGSLNFAPTASLYLAGMPSTTVTASGDSAVNAAAYQATSIAVVPGTWVSFTNLSGTSTVSPGSLPLVGPAGNSSYPVHHGQSWDNSPDSPGPENGIADAVMYEDAVAGVFLTTTEPDLNTAPATVDWTQASQQNKASYTNILAQQPFLIGTGKTTGGVVQQFLVPPGATRMYIGIWDGYQYYNNSTSPLTGTATASYYVQLVQ